MLKMKKAFIYLFLLSITCSCYRTNVIYYSKNIKKTIHNLEEMERWLRQDYENGDIPEYIAHNYMVVLVNSKCSLYKKLDEKSKEDCFD